MKFPLSVLRLAAIPACLLIASCTSEGDDPPVSGKPSAGSFLVDLIAPTDITQGYTSILGKVFTGVSPSAVSWKEAGSSGSCKLYTPKAPFCPAGCGSNALCVEDNKCMDFPKSISAGKVDVKGIKVKGSAVTSFSMTPVLNSYQQPGGTILDFPPFAEGETVTFTAAGDTGIGAFTVSVKGIPPLNITNDTIVLTDNQAINLKWTAPSDGANARISAIIDISHHGGTKGKIECEGPDNGSMEIAASLVTQLKALGVSGFPKIDVFRKAVGTNATVKVDVILESKVTKALTIPGLISCSDTSECPDGQTCQADMQCK